MHTKKMVVKKLIGSIIVFLITLTEFLPIMNNISFAAENPSDNIAFTGYFSSENTENASSFVCDVQESSLKANFEIKVKNKGYLKNGVLKLGDNLNFSIKEENELEIKNNQIKVKNLTQDKSETISIPIEFNKKDEYSEEFFNNSNKITFSGIYVDNEAVEHTIEKAIDLNLSWMEITSTKIENEITKNLDYQIDGVNGKIVQTIVKVSGNDKDNNLPLKSSELKIDIPQIAGMTISNINIEAEKLSYTQGREDYDINFSEENYSITEENKIVINIENEAIEGKIFNSYGEDIYVITYVYTGQRVDEEIIKGNMELKLENYAGETEEQTIAVEYDLNEIIGDAVRYTREDRESEISKGYLIADSENEKYEIDYTKKDVLNINRYDLISSLEIVDTDEYFVSNINEEKYYTENETGIMSSYKSTEFSKENLLNLLGEEGKVEILNMNDEVISTITLDLEADENNKYIVTYEEPISKIKIRTSKPIADGSITILSTKTIRKLNYSRNIVKNFYKLESVSNGFVTYNEGITNELGSVVSTIMINQTTSKASLEVAQTELSTVVKNESVNFQIRLNNNEDTSDLYENPIFEIRLPKAIKETNIKSIDLFYANNELELANIETFLDGEYTIIRITLKGLQTSYNINKETNGTVISFDVDLTLDKLTGNISESVEMCYYNVLATSYSNEFDWNMFISAENVQYQKNGVYIVPLEYKAPDELVNRQTTETKEESEETGETEVKDDEVSSTQQQATELIEEDAPAKLAVMSISIANNTSKSYSNFKILGRIPFAGNKDIVTGEDLGTTVDTILDSEIYSENQDLLYSVYYSENPEATDDIYNEANGWSMDFYKMGGIKSYLILLNSDYVLKPNDSLKFAYDYVIPAGLKSGAAFYGTYATYYQETTSEKSGLSRPEDKVGYETKKTTTLEASINLVGEKIKELSDVEYEIVLKNTTDVEAENVNIVLDIPFEFSIINIEGKDISGEHEDGKATINVGKIAGNSEEKIIIRFNVGKVNRQELENVAVDMQKYYESFLTEEELAAWEKEKQYLEANGELIENTNEETVEEVEEKIKITAQVEAENVSESLNIESAEVEVEETNIEINDEYSDALKIAGSEYSNNFSLINVSKNEYKNVKITKKLGEAFEFLRSTINTELNVTESYDSATKTITWEIESLKPGEYLDIQYDIYIKVMQYGEKINTNIIETECDLNNGETFVKKEEIEYYQSQVNIRNVNGYDVGYADSNGEVTYIWEFENNNDYDVVDFIIVPQVSENAEITGMRLETSMNQKDYHVDSVKKIFAVLPANTISRFIINAKIKEDASGFVEVAIDTNYDKVYAETSEVYTQLENIGSATFEITGVAYLDSNRNQMNDEEEILPGIIVNLYNSETNELIDSEFTDVSGRYAFKNINKGTYYVKFNYDESEYMISLEKSDFLVQNKSNIINVNDNYVTDNINIIDRSISNVDIALVNDNIFDMKVDCTVEKMTVQNSAESNEFISENKKLAKVDINPELVSDSKILVEYKIIVRNQGSISGTINKLVDYMPADMEFDSSLNPDWYMESDGNVYTRLLKDEVINPGETRELSLILIKNMTEENTGLIHNSVEIAEAINDMGIEDIDSTPANQMEEDDLSSADCIVGIATGLSISIIPIALVILIVVITLSVLVWRIIEKRRYV